MILTCYKLFFNFLLLLLSVSINKNKPTTYIKYLAPLIGSLFILVCFIKKCNSEFKKKLLGNEFLCFFKLLYGLLSNMINYKFGNNQNLIVQCKWLLKCNPEKINLDYLLYFFWNLLFYGTEFVCSLSFH